MTTFFSDYPPQNTVQPTSPGEVQEIIRKANKDRTPLIPVSSGINLQDTHLPSVKSATAVDLSRLNKIIYFDARNPFMVSISQGWYFGQPKSGIISRYVARTEACPGTSMAGRVRSPSDAHASSSWLKVTPGSMTALRFRASK